MRLGGGLCDAWTAARIRVRQTQRAARTTRDEGTVEGRGSRLGSHGEAVPWTGSSLGELRPPRDLRSRKPWRGWCLSRVGTVGNRRRQSQRCRPGVDAAVPLPACLPFADLSWRRGSASLAQTGLRRVENGSGDSERNVRAHAVLVSYFRCNK